jgi:hypothetical protein
LLVNQEEKELVDAIDGQRSINEIIHHTGRNQLDGWRTFFQKIWWYDQVSLEISNG